MRGDEKKAGADASDRRAVLAALEELGAYCSSCGGAVVARPPGGEGALLDDPPHCGFCTRVDERDWFVEWDCEALCWVLG